jgi:threonine/homoserine/homoserine lactone efflux protein
VLAVPFAYDALRLAGAAYLLWLAWQAVRPSGRSAFEPQALPPAGPRRLFLMGFLTSLLNPKLATLYLSLLPQFVDPELGNVFAQSLVLGLVQIVVSVTVKALVAFGAGSIARFLASRPVWATLQRYVMGTLQAAFALRMATEARR